MQEIVTDPARKSDLYVSDVAVGVLERTTGHSFEKETFGVHRATKPWKDWWAKNKESWKPVK